MQLRYAGLASAAFFLCLHGCQFPNAVPATETDGSYSKLPPAATRVVVWGTHPEAVNSLTAWLLKQGYTVVDGLKIRQLASDNNSPVPLSDVEVLKLARSAGAKQVIFVDADVVTWKMPDMLDLFGRSPNAYKATLLIRALDPETGEIDWHGKAFSVDRFPDLAKGIHQLTCNALATGWGLRKPGSSVNANVCPQESNMMVVKETPPSSQGPSPQPQLGAQRAQ